MQILSPCQIHSNTVSDPNECPALSHQPIMPSESIPMSNDGAAGEKNSRSPELSSNTFAHMKRSKQNYCYDSVIHIKPLFHKGCKGCSCPVCRELESSWQVSSVPFCPKKTCSTFHSEGQGMIASQNPNSPCHIVRTQPARQPSISAPLPRRTLPA